MNSLCRILDRHGAALEPQLKRLGVSRADFADPDFSLDECIAELNGRLDKNGRDGTGMISEAKLKSIRHYLTEFSLFHAI